MACTWTRVLHLHVLEVPYPRLYADRRDVAHREAEELVVGRLAGNACPQDPGVPAGQLEQHLAGMADADVPETARVHTRTPLLAAAP
jgi:hypothetical protein